MSSSSVSDEQLVSSEVESLVAANDADEVDEHLIRVLATNPEAYLGVVKEFAQKQPASGELGEYPKALLAIAQDVDGRLIGNQILDRRYADMIIFCNDFIRIALEDEPDADSDLAQDVSIIIDIAIGKSDEELRGLVAAMFEDEENEPEAITQEAEVVEPIAKPEPSQPAKTIVPKPEVISTSSRLAMIRRNTEHRKNNGHSGRTSEFDELTSELQRFLDSKPHSELPTIETRGQIRLVERLIAEGTFRGSKERMQLVKEELREARSRF